MKTHATQVWSFWWRCRLGEFGPTPAFLANLVCPAFGHPTPCRVWMVLALAAGFGVIAGIFTPLF